MEQDHRVLVTGGCGTLGSTVVSELLTRDGVDHVSVFDNDERGLFNARRRLEAESDQLQFILGDVRDRGKLERAFTDVDTVVHAAALKHVAVGERNPYEVVETNTAGTQNVIDAAQTSGVERVLGVSTDKAAMPTSVMGATKMLGERLLTAANRESDELTFGSVRLGNVLGSSGSVVRIFREQIADGGPVTVTHPDMSRFVFTPAEAGEFIVDGISELRGGEILVPKMDSIQIMDLADTMIETRAPLGVEPDEIDIEIVGMRPGERLHEQLITDVEAQSTIEFEDSFRISPHYNAKQELVSDGGTELTTPYHSNRAEQLSRGEIASLISDI